MRALSFWRRLLSADILLLRSAPRRHQIYRRPSSSRSDRFGLTASNRTAEYGYISLASAKRALGPPTDQYSWGAPIYVWHPEGIVLQTGWRGGQKGRIFKLHVYFEDSYDRRTEMKSGNFRGRLRVEGIAITPESKFESIRADLKSSGFLVTQGEVNYAKKGGLEIFESETTGRIARVDVWCP